MWVICKRAPVIHARGTTWRTLGLLAPIQRIAEPDLLELFTWRAGVGALQRETSASAVKRHIVP